MDGSAILALSTERLMGFVSAHKARSPKLISGTPYVCMSLLQKAIRRGDCDLALSAAATLLREAPQKLWRRIGCIAFEDVGLADTHVAEMATATLLFRHRKANIESEWQIVSSVVEAMVTSAKCRAADDLLMCAERHPALTRWRNDMPGMAISELFEIISASDSLLVKSLAVWFAIGTDRRPSPFLASCRGDPDGLFDWFVDSGYPVSLVEVARANFKKTSEVLAPLAVLLWPIRNGETSTYQSDEFFSSGMAGCIPTWSLDIYTREGRRALGRFAKGATPTARWLQANVEPSRRVGVLGNAVFRLDGSLCANRMVWPTGDKLRALADLNCIGLSAAASAEFLPLVKTNMGLIDAERNHEI